MKIKLVERILGISRETVRYYEKEHLINPKHCENKYREYEDSDIKQLKLILVMRKLGVSVADIRGLLRGELNLGSVLESNILRLKKEQEDIARSIQICEEITAETVEEFDTDHYFDVLKNLEDIQDRERVRREDFLPVCIEEKPIPDQMVSAH